MIAQHLQSYLASFSNEAEQQEPNFEKMEEHQQLLVRSCQEHFRNIVLYLHYPRVHSIDFKIEHSHLVQKEPFNAFD